MEKRRKTSVKKKISEKAKKKGRKDEFSWYRQYILGKERTTDSNTTACEIAMPDFYVV